MVQSIEFLIFGIGGSRKRRYMYCSRYTGYRREGQPRICLSTAIAGSQIVERKLWYIRINFYASRCVLD